MIDQQYFLRCCQQVEGNLHLKSGIGSVGEKAVHAVLKNYYAPNPADQEINLGSFVADIAGREGVIEIQTSGFGRLRPKLERLLELGPVRIVYPVLQVKWVSWVDPETGELSPRRRSPKRAGPWEVLRELVYISTYLTHPNLRVTVVLLEAEEQRLRDGWGRDGKRGSHRYHTRPLALLREVTLDSPEDYAQLLPPGLPGEFTAKEFGKSSRLSPRGVWAALRVLEELGLVRRGGKRGRSQLYQIPPELSTGTRGEGQSSTGERAGAADDTFSGGA